MSQFTRREFLGTAVAGAAVSAERRQRPNIMVILLDDLGWGQFGPNSDLFELSQLNPVLRERDPETRPAAAFAAPVFWFRTGVAPRSAPLARPPEHPHTAFAWRKSGHPFMLLTQGGLLHG